MTRFMLAACLLVGTYAVAQGASEVPELALQAEHPVEGMRGGNLSGLALCAGQLWAVSDRDDDRVYRLERSKPVWQGQPLMFKAPTAPKMGLPLNLVIPATVLGLVRGGSLDFEGIACDNLQQLYVVSEAKATVLKISPSGEAKWLPLPAQLVTEARQQGLLRRFNALFEGLAVDPEAQHLWLAAEREQRGLIHARLGPDGGVCGDPCVLLSEGGTEQAPAHVHTVANYPKDFSDLTYFKGKLFTLERNAYKMCRRDARTAQVERCWSFAEAALQPARRYDNPYGLVEALALDDTAAWIGTDNNDNARSDGEKRPVVWRFAAPAGGWLAP